MLQKAKEKEVEEKIKEGCEDGLKVSFVDLYE